MSPFQLFLRVLATEPRFILFVMGVLLLAFELANPNSSPASSGPGLVLPSSVLDLPVNVADCCSWASGHPARPGDADPSHGLLTILAGACVAIGRDPVRQPGPTIPA